LLLRLSKFAGPLVKLLFEIGPRGSVGAPKRCLFAAIGLRRLSAARFHDCVDLTGGINSSDVTSGPRLMRLSHDGSRQRPKYTTCGEWRIANGE